MSEVVGLSQGEKRALSALEEEIVTPISMEVPKSDELLFHYTDAVAFKEIVKTKEFWATHSCYLNDSKEIRHGEDLVEKEATALAASSHDKLVSVFVAAFIKGFAANRLSEKHDLYIVSFSQEPDSLSQWRAYGGNGAGYALGFRHAPSTPMAKDDGLSATALHRCDYHEDEFRGRVAQVLRAAVSAIIKYRDVFGGTKWQEEVIQTALAAVYLALTFEVPRLKHASFHEEREWRVVVTPGPSERAKFPEFRSRNGYLVPFRKVRLDEDRGHGCLTLAEVVVGPSEDPQRAELAARMLLSSLGQNPGIVRRSQIPFRAR